MPVNSTDLIEQSNAVSCSNQVSCLNQDISNLAQDTHSIEPNSGNSAINNTTDYAQDIHPKADLSSDQTRQVIEPIDDVVQHNPNGRTEGT